MKRLTRIVHRVLALMTPMLCLTISGCNEKSDSTTSYTPSSSVAITSFRLRPDTKVMANLDSVFFSIDLAHGVVFNADSLPVGTDVTRLVPVIVYPSGITSATLRTMGGTYEETIDYKKAPTDSVDFSGDVSLTLVAEDGTTSATYRLKVNVHKTYPDSLMWDKLGVADLPSRLSSPLNQKTVGHDDKSYSFIAESDGSYTLAVSDNLFEQQWTKTEVTPGFSPDIRSFVASDKEFYILNTEGELFSSSDALNWNSTGIIWKSIIGGYGDWILGLRTDPENGRILHTSWPAGEFEETPADPDFPLTGFSNFPLFLNKWAPHPIGTLSGGIKADGSCSDATWAFDGRSWALLSKGNLPALRDATIIPYFSYLQSSSAWVQTEYTTWLLIGGVDENGKVNPRTYISYDYGVNWHIGDPQVQLPDYFQPLYESDQVVMNTPRSASLSDSWTKVKSRTPAGMKRLPHTTDGTTILWDCPYIYTFGGFLEGGVFYPMVRRGVLERLTFAPLI